MPLRWRVFFVFAFGHFMSYFLRNANAVLADDLAVDLSLRPEQLGLMTSLYLLVFAAAQLPFGAVLDRWGARFSTSGLLLLAAVGSFVFSAATGFLSAGAARALIGLGTAGALMGAFKSLSGHFSQKRFGLASGALVALGSMGALLAATPLAWFQSLAGWRAAFVVAGGAVVVAAALIALVATPGPGASGDAPHDDADDEATDGADVGEAGIDGGEGGFGLIFRNPRFWRFGALGFALSGSSFAWQSLWAGPYLSTGIGLEQVAVGNVLVGFGAGITAGYLVAGVVATRVGVPRTMLGAGLATLAVQIALAFRPAPGDGVLTLLFFVLGAALASSLQLFAQARAAFPLSHTGRAVTALNLCMFGGGFVQQWLLGVLLTATGGPEPGPGAFGVLFVASAILTIAALAIYLPELRTRGD